jgi:hypothetical protein
VNCCATLTIVNSACGKLHDPCATALERHPMKWKSQYEKTRNLGSDQNFSPPDIRLSDADRLEAFSDGVFSITITLLVFDIVRPQYQAGYLFEKLLAQWPNYIAFPCLIFLHRHHLAQSPSGFLASSLLQPQPASGKPVAAADLGPYPISDGGVIYGATKWKSPRRHGSSCFLRGDWRSHVPVVASAVSHPYDKSAPPRGSR